MRKQQKDGLGRGRVVMIEYTLLGVLAVLVAASWWHAGWPSALMQAGAAGLSVPGQQTAVRK